MVYSIIYGICAVLQFFCFLTMRKGTKVLHLTAAILFTVVAILYLR